MAIISSKIDVKITSSMIRKANAAALQKIERHLLLIKNDIKNEAKDIVEKQIKKHRVYKSLNSDLYNDETGRDLRAEFGLYPEQASSALSSMLKYLLDLVDAEVLTSMGAKSRPVSLRVIGPKREDYLSELSGGDKYSYKSKGRTIRWMALLLHPYVPVETLISAVNHYMIVYGYFKSTWSRSLRAIMRKSENFPYIVPKFIQPTKNEDFIQEALSTPIQGKQFKTIVKEKIIKSVRRLGTLPRGVK